jgi:Dullard-like phosphatase family protein
MNLEASEYVCPAIVLDLDETLISTSLIRPESESIAIRVRRRQLFVRPRPGLSHFIKSLSDSFDIYFFTSSAREYANPIIDAIAPETPGERRFFRDSCIPYCGYPVKDLRLLGRPLSRVLLIDDLEGSALMQPENLIRVSAWQGIDESDNVLIQQLLPALIDIAQESDLRIAFMNSAQRHQYHGLFLSSMVSRECNVPAL